MSIYISQQTQIGTKKLILYQNVFFLFLKKHTFTNTITKFVTVHVTGKRNDYIGSIIFRITVLSRLVD